MRAAESWLIERILVDSGELSTSVEENEEVNNNNNNVNIWRSKYPIVHSLFIRFVLLFISDVSF
jgi:hypothetical protein